MLTLALSVTVSETTALTITSAAQTSTTLTDPSPPIQSTAIIIGVGVTCAFVFGILVSAIVLAVITLACRTKKNTFAGNVAANQCVGALDNSAGSSGNSALY